MKIGVCLCGSGRCALCAEDVINRLEEHGFIADTVCASSLSAVGILKPASDMEALFSCKERETFLTEVKTQLTGTKIKDKIVIGAYDLLQGKSVLFTEDDLCQGGNVRVLHGVDGWRAVRSALCPYLQTAPYLWNQMALCDLSARYGAPLFVPGMQGCDLILCVYFQPNVLEPYDLAMQYMYAQTGKQASMQIRVVDPEEQSMEGLRQAAIHAVDAAASGLYQALLQS